MFSLVERPQWRKTAKEAIQGNQSRRRIRSPGKSQSTEGVATDQSDYPTP
jgi:hypothetical protein